MARDQKTPILPQYYFGLSEYATQSAVDIAYAKSRMFFGEYIAGVPIGGERYELATKALAELANKYEYIKSHPPVLPRPAAFYFFFPLVEMALRSHMPLLAEYFFGLKKVRYAKELDDAYNQKKQEFQASFEPGSPELNAVYVEALEALDKAYAYLKSREEYEKFIEDKIPEGASFFPGSASTISPVSAAAAYSNP